MQIYPLIAYASYIHIHVHIQSCLAVYDLYAKTNCFALDDGCNLWLIKPLDSSHRWVVLSQVKSAYLSQLLVGD